jgi:hypothetical protein
VAVPLLIKGTPKVQSSLEPNQRSSPARRYDLDAFYAEEETGEDETEGSEETESEDEQEANLK